MQKEIDLLVEFIDNEFQKLSKFPITKGWFYDHLIKEAKKREHLRMLQKGYNPTIFLYD